MRIVAEPADPELVIVAHDRPAALKRLLSSLAQATYPGHGVPLTVSIDQSARSAEVEAVASAFDWTHGAKTILAHPRHLGLRAHVLACGDLALERRAIVLLEEDVSVSPCFYEFLQRVVPAYAEDARVAGVGLCLYGMHPYAYVESLSPVFAPLEDGGDTWFARYAPSWGECVTGRQWGAFRSWLGRRDATTGSPGLRRVPRAVREWPEDSWKKLFIEHLVDCDRYFAFPRVALSVHWGDAGSHLPWATDRFQVPLRVGTPAHLEPTPLVVSRARYDAHFEIEPGCLAAFDDALGEHDFECDLYGVKEAGELSSPLVLTARRGPRALRRWADEMTPPELNVALGLEGDGLRLVRAEDAIPAGQTGPVPVSSRYAFSPRDPFGDPRAGALRVMRSSASAGGHPVRTA